ncbi:2071_t:CDS:2 [Acaulospora morrowiae]|uniref:2071_t:CDS:1 n=1 Tax=Acaulospora morrowiae TaxID=94023 RepID=A0A9N9A933_9GLOM|nr:2071_t:CDS:2 [Acaulospora morrowiae]
MSSSDRSQNRSQGQDGNNRGGNQEGAPQQQQQETQSAFQSIIQVIFRIMIVYWLVTFIFKGKNNTPSTPPPIIDVPSGVDIPQTHPNEIKPKNLYPSWPMGSSMDLHVYVSEKEYFTDFNDPSALIWHTSNIHYGDWNEERESEVEIETSAAVRNNGSLYAHIYLTLEKATPNPLEPGYQDGMIVYTRKLLTRYYPKRKIIKTKNLILDSGGDKEIEEEDNLTLNIVSDYAIIPYHQLLPSVASVVSLDPSKYIDPNTQGGYYLPVLFNNDFWVLREHLTPINETVKYVLFTSFSFLTI